VVDHGPELEAMNDKLDALLRTVEAQDEVQKRLESKLDALTAQVEAAKAAPTPTLAGMEDDNEPPPAFEGVTCPAREGSKRRCTITRGALDELLANPAVLAKQARVVPAVRDGETRGYKLYGIRRGSLPKALAIKNGDMLIAVNGTTVTSPDEALDLYAKLRTSDTVTMEFDSRGTRYELKVSIVNE